MNLAPVPTFHLFQVIKNICWWLYISVQFISIEKPYSYNNLENTVWQKYAETISMANDRSISSLVWCFYWFFLDVSRELLPFSWFYKIQHDKLALFRRRSWLTKNLYLKGHGNLPVFSILCINWFGLGPLNHHSSCSDYDFEFAEIFKLKIDSPHRW